MSFSAIVTGIFAISEGRICLTIAELEGMPAVADVIRVSGGVGRIVELGRNSTDGQVISTRSCLTGQVVPPYGAIAVIWDTPPKGALRQQRIEGAGNV